MKSLLKKRFAYLIAGTLLLAGGVTFYLKLQKPTTSISYREVKVEKGDIELAILATGVVQPQNRLEIKPPIAGRVEKVFVDEGYSVHRNQTLLLMSSTERAALIDAARARGPEELKKWEEYYKPTPVLAPIQGMIIQRNIQPGQTFSVTDPILVMSDRLAVQAQVDETDIAQIKIKQRASIVLDAYPKETLIASVDKIAYDAKTVNNVTTYIVYVSPHEIPAHLRSGMTAVVKFISEFKMGVLTVPADSVKRQKDGSWSVLANREETQVPITVKVGISDGKRTEITSGLQEGDTILQPVFKLGGKGPQNSSPFSPMPSSHRPSK